MTDVFTRKKRSEIMAAIKGRNTKSTELVMRRLLREQRITGWRRNLECLPGRPDFAFPDKHIAVFVDGCFWHGCRTCTRNRRPAANADFWLNKIAGNMKRDRRVNRSLKARGWKVLRIWEHALEKRSDFVVRRMLRAVNGDES